MHTGWRSAVLPLHGRTFVDKKSAYSGAQS